MKVLAVLVWLLLVCFLPHYFQGWYQLAFYIAYTLVLWFGSSLLESHTRFGAYISGWVAGFFWQILPPSEEDGAPVWHKLKVQGPSLLIMNAFARGFSCAAMHPFVVSQINWGSAIGEFYTRFTLVPVRANTGAHMK